MSARRGLSSRILVLTGSGLSLIVFGLALFAHNALYRNDLGRAERLESEIRARLDGDRAAKDVPPKTSLPRGDFEALVDELPETTAVDARTMYDDSERATFAATRTPAIATDESEPGLTSPQRLSASYQAGGVALRWDAGDANRELAGQLPPDQHLAFRIYRSTGLAAASLRATVGFDTDRWRDGELPLAATELAYEVWAVQLRDDKTGPVLVSAEPSDMVTVQVPEHFRLVLVAGSSEQVTVRVEVGPASTPVAAHELVLTPGEALVVGGRPTGLVLSRIDESEEERLVTRNRLVFTSDGGLVLDPVTEEPRTTTTQVLMPVRRLIATLTDELGATRTLELDLP